jgi:AcrR family transcriptional regulator
MDIRAKKTRSSIINAFLELRSKKPLEKITIKELSEKAMINKATFYLHFKDIYDLSDNLETEIAQSVVKSIQNPEKIAEAPDEAVREIISGYLSQMSLIKIVFEGKRADRLVSKTEEAIKKALFEKHPEKKDDLEENVFISFLVCGTYYAFVENRGMGESLVMERIAKMAKAVADSRTKHYL